MHLFSWLMAQSYDLLLRRTEQRCLARWRSELLHQARGKLLEIGAGTGLNLPHYPTALSDITLSEPDAQMRGRLQRKLNGAPHNIELQPWGAEQLALPDNSCDTIVSTLVLCSVNDLRRSLQELHRLLRPGGQLLFLEHVLARDPATRRWQHRWEPLWRCCSGNCHLTRDTLAEIEACGLQLEQVKEGQILGAPSILRRAVRGIARKPD